MSSDAIAVGVSQGIGNVIMIRTVVMAAMKMSALVVSPLFG